MIKSKWISAIMAVCMSLILMIIAAAYIKPELFLAASVQTERPYVSLMDGSSVMDIEIIVSAADWESLLADAAAKEYIPATVIINSVSVQNVGIRPKGSSSLGAAAKEEAGRYSLKIEFDHYIDGQTWMGLDKLCLNNMYSDASYMKEFLSYDIMRYSGVDTPVYSYANISVNGERWGFYLAIEAVEDSFVSRNYGNKVGAIYKPDSLAGDEKLQAMERRPEALQPQPEGNPQRIPDNNPGGGLVLQQGPAQQGAFPNEQPGEGRKRRMIGGGSSSPANALQYIDDDPSSYATIFENSVFDTTFTQKRALIKALKNLNDGTALEAYVDIDAVLRYLAAHTVVVNLDSYISNMTHNYYLREHDGRISMIPWDYNMAFGGFSSPSSMDVVNFPIDTPIDKMISLEDRPLVARLLAVPEYKGQYHAYLQDIIDGYFESGAFEQTFMETSRRIDEYVRNDPSSFYTYEEFEAAVPVLKELIERRTQSIKGQLDGTIPSAWPDQNERPDMLVDASDIPLEALGGGKDSIVMMVMVNGVSLNLSEFEIQDMEVLGEAAHIVKEAAGVELTEEQFRQLFSLGLSEADIKVLKSSVNAGIGAVPMDGNQMHVNADMASNRNKSPAIDAGAAAGIAVTGNLTVLCCCVAALILGLAFANAFKRNKR